MAKNADPILNPDDIIQKRWQYYADADRVLLVNENGNVISDDNPLATTASLTISGDIQIGAVEIKDGITDERATVDSSGNLYTKDRDLLIAFNAKDLQRQKEIQESYPDFEFLIFKDTEMDKITKLNI